MKLTTMITALGLVMSFAGTAHAADLKLGYVDLEKAIQETAAGKKAKKNLEKEYQEKKKELDKKKSDLDKMQEDLTKKKSVLSDDARAKKEQEFQQEAMKFQETVRQTEFVFRKKELDALKPIVDKLQDVLDKVAKEGGYSMIFLRSEKTFEQPVVWAKKELDVTDAVVKAFEKAGEKK